jgi:hypothetical protein
MQTTTNRLTHAVSEVDAQLAAAEERYNEETRVLTEQRNGLLYALDVLGGTTKTSNKRKTVNNRRMGAPKANETNETGTKRVYTHDRSNFFLSQVKAGNHTVASMVDNAVESGLFSDPKDFRTRSYNYLRALVNSGKVVKNTESNKHEYHLSEN